jgi:hypothetical protein
MAVRPITSWYCLITASGVGPMKKYRSTSPPITLQATKRGAECQQYLHSDLLSPSPVADVSNLWPLLMQVWAAKSGGCQWAM